MAARRIEIKLGPNGTGQVLVDGHDLSGAVKVGGVMVESGGHGQPPVLTLDLVTACVEITQISDGEPLFYVDLPDRTREALLALGWTPPQ